jgi:hypothetical protein
VASPTHCQLLIISRDTLLRAQKGDRAAQIFRLLANITRKGRHLILTAPEPDQWFPTRGSGDDALAHQGILNKEIADAGGDMEGIYYVRRSRFTQNRNRLGALKDILSRYAIEPQLAFLISTSRPFIKAAERLGINTASIPKSNEGVRELERLLRALADTD